MKKKGMGLMLRKLLAMTICFVSFAALVVMNLGAAEETINNASDNGSEIGTALLTDYWMDDSEAAQSLNDYLLAVTDETSSDYIPVGDRIAVFDLDGTLMCETSGTTRHTNSVDCWHNPPPVSEHPLQASFPHALPLRQQLPYHLQKEDRSQTSIKYHFGS